jgi:hypothetical protein
METTRQLANNAVDISDARYTCKQRGQLRSGNRATADYRYTRPTC